MTHYDYVIIGAGMAADAAVKGIREIDQEGTIAVIGQEPHPPYARPPLSKKLWQGKPFDSIWRGTETLGVTLSLGRRAEALDAANRRVRDDRGCFIHYDRLLLATGGTPRRLPFGGNDVIYFRTLDDYRQLRSLADRGGRFVVIGGGFIGSEIAAALAMSGSHVVMIFPENGVCSRAFPDELAAFVTDHYRSKGVEILTGEGVTDISRNGAQMVVTTRGGREIVADGVVAGIGIEPNVELARQAELPVANGIEVDEYLRAGRPEIFAAGDVASFFSPVLGERVRVEHEDNALIMGRQAGRNMAGANEAYRHLPFFYSDLFELGYEAVGEVDSRLQTVADWKEPFREGVVYYLREGRVRGVLLWNVWEQVEAARKLINLRVERQEELLGRLPAAG